MDGWMDGWMDEWMDGWMLLSSIVFVNVGPWQRGTSSSAC